MTNKISKKLTTAGAVAGVIAILEIPGIWKGVMLLVIAVLYIVAETIIDVKRSIPPCSCIKEEE